MNDVTLKEITAELQLTARRAQQLAKAGIFVKATRGRYDLCKSAIQYALFLRRTAGAETSLPVMIDDLARCIGETTGNARNLERKGLFKKTSHGHYDLLESVRGYIDFQKTEWRGRGRRSCRNCGTLPLPLPGPGAEL